MQHNHTILGSLGLMLRPGLMRKLRPVAAENQRLNLLKHPHNDRTRRDYVTWCGNEQKRLNVTNRLIWLSSLGLLGGSSCISFVLYCNDVRLFMLDTLLMWERSLPFFQG